MSLPVNCAISNEKDDCFDLLNVKVNDKTVLIIRLISLKTWVNLKNQALGKFQGLLLKQKDNRHAGIACVILWEDLWIMENEIVESRLSAILGISQRIPGRMTKVRRIDKPTAVDFLNKNHLQHSVSAKFKYGLYLPKQYFRILKAENQFDTSAPELLVGVATFSHPRIFEREGKPFRSYELIRFANLKYSTVVGGFDKLLRAFEEDCKPDDIMTYADLDWSDGASYKRLGFDAVSEKDPIPFYLDLTSLKRFSIPGNNDIQSRIQVYNGGSRKFVKEILASFARL